MLLDCDNISQYWCFIVFFSTNKCIYGEQKRLFQKHKMIIIPNFDWYCNPPYARPAMCDLIAQPMKQLFVCMNDTHPRLWLCIFTGPKPSVMWSSQSWHLWTFAWKAQGTVRSDLWGETDGSGPGTHQPPGITVTFKGFDWTNDSIW